MSYSTIHAISQSQTLRNRCSAAAAEQGVQAGEEDHWVYRNALRLAAQPGWSAAWESALAAGNEQPGADPAVITDGMILAAVTGLLGVSGG
jgi:hypothetical protein